MTDNRRVTTRCDVEEYVEKGMSLVGAITVLHTFVKNHIENGDLCDLEPELNAEVMKAERIVEEFIV